MTAIRISKIQRFYVPGQPVAKGRPKVYRVCGHTRAVTPKPTVDFENRVRFAALDAGIEMIDGPVQIVIYAFFSLPKGKHRKRQPRPADWKTTKPDIDNVVKAVTDALNSIAYTDDSQVVDSHGYKLHAAQGNPATTLVEIRSPQTALAMLAAHSKQHERE